MIIKFKNKHTMALHKMIDDGARLGGLPSHIEISPNEAIEILKEVNTLNPPPTGYVFTSKDGVSLKLLISAKPISAENLVTYAANWKSGEWKVEYRKVPIHIVNPTPQTVHLHS